MTLIQSLREMWQRHTGEEETPLDGDTPSFVVSLLVHMAVVIALGMIPILTKNNNITLMMVVDPPKEEQVEPELTLPDQFYFSELPSEKVGANSDHGTQMALAQAPVVSEVSVVPTPEDFEVAETGTVELNQMVKVATGPNFNANLAVKGAVGSGTTGASGAVDRITHEILLSLEERKTLVVWVFDQTASLVPQRNTMKERFERIYRELGVIESAGNEAFTRHDDKPLLSSVVSFGNDVRLITKKPTDNIEELKNAVSNLPNDESGNEKIFTAIQDAAKHFAEFRYVKETTGQPERNVMIVAFTDEVGSDQDQVEPTVKICRRYAMPVYVVGVPAPFGRQETMMKWVDPDPKFDQTAQWGRVDQGPESLMPERIKLAFFDSKADEDPIDSGFGPFALTRLCYETGGIYFAVHPNRNVQRAVSRNEVAAYSAHLKNFFDPEIMRPYRPDYVSVDEYKRRLMQNKCRAALVQAATFSQITPMESPKLKFVKRDEGTFSEALSEAQRDAAKLEPKIDQLFEVLKLGEGDREKETTPRWQAGFDLAVGRVLAMKVRTESYNAMLAGAKRGLPVKDKKNNTFTLEPADDITVGSQLAKLGERAKMYLNRVVTDHPDTPWAMLAQQELKEPLGWKWTDSFTDLAPMRAGAGNGNAPAPANDAKMMLEKPAPKRAPPKL